jgi:hypothetical protein
VSQTGIDGPKRRLLGHNHAIRDVYREWAPNNVARSHSTAQEGNLSSFTKNNTVVVSELVPVIVYAPRVDVHKLAIDEVVAIDFIEK